MVASYAGIGLDRTVVVVEAVAESDPALMAALAYWGCKVVHASDTREVLGHMAKMMPALLVVPDGGSTRTGSYMATVAGRGRDTVRRSERPQDTILQRPVDPTDLEDLLNAVFGPAGLPLSSLRESVASAAA